MKRRHLIPTVLAAMITIQLISVPAAFAADTLPETATTTMNNDGTLAVEQSYLSTDEAPIPAETITQDGQDFTLDQSSTATDPTYQPPTQSFARQAFSQVPIEGINNLGAYFPATYPIDEGEFQGEIGLDPLNPFTVLERYHSYRVQVDRQVVIEGLPDNDVTRIPVYRDFEVLSDTTPGATMIGSLQLLDVSYAITGTDHLGLPNNYTAYVTYRGQEGLHELAFYDVTAHYSGELTSSIGQMISTATYKPVPVPAPGPEETTVVSPEVPLAEPDFPLFPLTVAGTTIVVLLAVPLLYFFVLSNARLIRTASPDTEPEKSRFLNKEQPTSELVCRRRLVLREDVATFRVPPNVDILDGAQYSLHIKPRIAGRDGQVRIVWQGKEMAVLPLAKHIVVNFREMLITSAEAAIMEFDFSGTND